MTDFFEEYDFESTDERVSKFIEIYTNTEMSPEDLKNAANSMYVETSMGSFDHLADETEDYRAASKFFQEETETVEEEGGEGEGDYACYTYFFKKANVYLKLEGGYASYVGYDFSDGEFFIAKPVEVTVTKYEAI